MDELKIPKLHGENYNAWSIRTRAALVQKNCWEAIEPGYGTELHEEERKTNEKALTFLFLVVDDEFLDDIADCIRARDAWTCLKDIHTKFGLLHTLQLLREFFNVTMSPGESMSIYLGRITDLHRKVSSCGHGFTDREVALVMLMGLSKEYESLILNLEQHEKDLSTRIVKSRLIVEEKKLSRHCSEGKHEAVGERALITKDNGRFRTQEMSKNYPRSNARKTRCFACGQWGHIARNCSISKTTPHAKMVSDDAYQALSADASGAKPVCDWYLDSGATEHMCSQKQKFINLVSSKSKVEIANSERIEVSGTGDIVFKPVEECGKETIFLANVLYVPKLDGNLLSVGRIEEMGMTITFQKGRAIIRNPKQQNKVILIAHRCGRLYKVEEQMYKANISKHEELVHRRLGHLNTNAVKKLIRDDSAGSCDKDLDENNICSTNILGKMKKIPFSTKRYKLWNVDEEDKSFVNQNVRFDETVFPFRRSKPVKQIETELTFRLHEEVPDINVIRSQTPSSDATAEFEQDLEDPGQSTTSADNYSDVRRSNRERRSTTHYGDSILYKAVTEVPSVMKQDPTSLKEEMESFQAEMWKEAIKEELNNLDKQQTWELVSRPSNVKLIGCKWVLKKFNTEGEVVKYG